MAPAGPLIPSCTHVTQMIHCPPLIWGQPQLDPGPFAASGSGSGSGNLAVKMKASAGKYEAGPARPISLTRILPRLRGTASRCIAASLSAASWLQVESVARKVKATAGSLGLSHELPLSSDTLINLVLEWVRTGLKGSTIRTYLGRISTLHQLEGLRMERDPLLERLVQGWENTEPGACGRLAVTPPILRIINEKVAEASWHQTRKARFWCTATLLFAGALRSAEILPDKIRSFKRDSTLMPQDLLVTTDQVDGKIIEFVKLKIKAPKEKKGCNRESWVEIFATGNFWCPVRALKEFLTIYHPHPPHDQPLLRRQDGSGYTCQMFNADIRELLKSSFDYSNQRILSHSFRAGDLHCFHPTAHSL